MGKRLFGTDGIRAEAGRPPLDPDTIQKVGAALAVHLQETLGRRPKVLLGRDTRESGVWIREVATAGLRGGGAQAADAGIISTPGLAYAVRHAGFDAGMMISASHNPFEDNGIKLFGPEGTKLPDAFEEAIEAKVLDDPGSLPPPVRGASKEDPGHLRAYLDFLHTTVSGEADWSKLSVVLDCANGAAVNIAPEIFRRLGARVETLGVDPDGRNINLGCGSLHLDALAAAVRKGGFDLGFAFDGDADRVLAVDSRGRTADGDYLLYLGARRLLGEGRLRGHKVVATVMSNLWLDDALRKEGVQLLRTSVGDKYVFERMVVEGAALGGEQSGHLIFMDLNPTGDGVLAGLVVADTLLHHGLRLESLLDTVRPYPQKLISVRVREKPDLRTHPVIGPRLQAMEASFNGAGRILLRYSGTEPVARVMVEGRDAEGVSRRAQELAELIRAELGA